jgi:hypothetical protein
LTCTEASSGCWWKPIALIDEGNTVRPRHFFFLVLILLAPFVSAELEIDVLDYNADVPLKRGDAVFLTATIQRDNRPVESGVLFVEIFNDSKLLVDNGESGDLNAGDKTYSRIITIPSTAPEGKHDLVFTLKSKGEEAQLTKKLLVQPTLIVEIATNETEYVLGDPIVITGNVPNQTGILRKEGLVKIVQGQNTLFSQDVLSDPDTGFSSVYQTQKSDPQGVWTARFSLIDEFNNSGIGTTSFSIIDADIGTQLTIRVIEPKTELFSRGEIAPFMVKVDSPTDQPVSDALVTVAILDKRAIVLEEIDPGIYSASIQIPIDTELGVQPFTISVVKDVNGINFFGESVKSLGVQRIPVRVEIVSPATFLFRSGDVLNLVFTAEYANKQKIQAPDISVVLGSQPLSISEQDDGVFSAAHVIPFDLSGDENLSISVADRFGNTTFIQKTVLVEQENLVIYILKTDFLIFVVVGLVIAGIVISLLLFVMRSQTTKKLHARKRELMNAVAEIQRLYYRDGRMGKEEYRKLFQEYSVELDRVDTQLEKNKKA